MKDVRIAKLATTDMAYENGARWIVAEPKWVGDEVQLRAAKLATLEAAVLHAEAGKSCDYAQDWEIDGSYQLVSVMRETLDGYRRRRNDGQIPPMGWVGIFNDD